MERHYRYVTMLPSNLYRHFALTLVTFFVIYNSHALHISIVTFKNFLYADEISYLGIETFTIYEHTIIDKNKTHCICIAAYVYMHICIDTNSYKTLVS